jgi:hypothetical protein
MGMILLPYRPEKNSVIAIETTYAVLFMFAGRSKKPIPF